MMPVGVAERAREKIPIKWPADIGGNGVAEFFRVKRNGMVLVDRLAIHDGLDWCFIVIRFGLSVAGELSDMAVLAHVEMQPFFFVKPLGGSVPSRRMESHEMISAIA